MLRPVQHAEHEGFTLIEVMVAMVILLIGMMALLQTVNVSIAYNYSNKLRSTAVLFADEKIGTERTKLFSNVVSGTETVTSDNVTFAILRNVSSLTSHSVATDKIAGSKRLRLQVSWPDRGKTKYHSLTTTIVEPAN